MNRRVVGGTCHDRRVTHVFVRTPEAYAYPQRPIRFCDGATVSRLDLDEEPRPLTCLWCVIERALW